MLPARHPVTAIKIPLNFVPFLMTYSLTLQRFRNSSDVEYFFQRELDKFLRVKGRVMLAEFGALMIRPKDEPQNRLTHLAFRKP